MFWTYRALPVAWLHGNVLTVQSCKTDHSNVIAENRSPPHFHGQSMTIRKGIELVQKAICVCVCEYSWCLCLSSKLTFNHLKLGFFPFNIVSTLDGARKIKTLAGGRQQCKYCDTLFLTCAQSKTYPTWGQVTQMNTSLHMKFCSDLFLVTFIRS